MHMYNLSLLVYCQNTEISLGFDFEQTLIEPIYDYHHAAGSWGGGIHLVRRIPPYLPVFRL